MGSTSTKIKLRTSDQKVFKVEEAVVVQYLVIKYFYENGCPGSVILVHSVSSNILSKILDYYKKHAANCLKIESLLDLTCQTIANMIKGKRPEEIRTTFNIKNNYTPEAEEAVRKKWAFDMLGV
ncbi:hypothetical protein Goarm_012758 [Gossypium armourianum]|uniref:SKP1-like protein n=1 Tax=Gossypium armourianum TaxID=34283 RepID=A0A7J9J1P3_9ROSI|nr:hypothetical protein [Gossypium armourianum]